jgi:tRNA-specific 2-thiouridylase
LVAREINWLTESCELSADSRRLTVQVRHRANAAAATIIRHDSDEIELALDEPIAAITPGQSVVFYDGERVLGGGIIERANRGSTRSALPILAA